MSPRNRPGKRSPRRPRLESLEDRALAAVGVLDPTFGTGGTTQVPFPSGSIDLYSYFQAVLPQADGRIVLGDVASLPDPNAPPRIGIPSPGIDATAIERLNADGSPDPTFGSDGQVVLMAKDGVIAMAPDGKVVVAGTTVPSAGATAMGFVVRLDADGSLDTTFNGTGELDYSLDDGPAPLNPSAEGVFQPSKVAVRSDGVIAIAGLADDSQRSGGPVAFVQVTADGRLDPNFSTTGHAEVVAPNFDVSSLTQLEYRGDRILAEGFFVDNFFHAVAGVALIQLDADGSPDPSFGSGGVVSLGSDQLDSFLTHDQGLVSGNFSAPAADPLGRILVSGTTPTSMGVDAFVARLDRSGNLDTTFGPSGTGIVTIPTGPMPLASLDDVDSPVLAVGAGGGITLANQGSISPQTGEYDLSLIQLTPSGNLDTNRPDGGQATFPDPGTRQAEALVFDAQGRLLVLAPGSTASLYRVVYSDVSPTVSGFAFARAKKAYLGDLTLTFSEPLDPSTASQVGSYELVSAGPDRIFGNRNDKVLKLTSASYDAATNTVTIQAAGRVRLNQPLELVARGAAIKDRNGNALAGAGNGVAGLDHVVQFGAKPRTPRPKAPAKGKK